MAVTFNDTTNEQGIVQELRFLSGQDSLSIADATRALNFALDRYTHLAITSSGTWVHDDATNATRGKATANLTAGTREYRFQASFLVLDEVEVEYEGEWKTVDRVDSARDHDERPLSESYSTNGKPTYYDMRGDELFLYPAPDSSATRIRVWYRRAINHFATTDTTSTIGIPSTHIRYLPLHAALSLSIRNNDRNYNKIDDQVKRMENEIKEFYGMREANAPQQLQGVFNVFE